jgi:hypothetical protein
MWRPSAIAHFTLRHIANGVPVSLRDHSAIVGARLKIDIHSEQLTSTAVARD